uniref:Uncharacterized protein n=1 Tax=Cuerna arida TaxID=1464854 RepID=A0A1B6G4I8_9HEMI
MHNSTFYGEDEWDLCMQDEALGNDMDITLAGSQELEFPLLSENCISPNTPWPEDPVIENLTLNKSSPKKDPQDKTKKNPADIMKDTENILKFYMKQSKHQRAIQNELKGLLEHEKNILEQLVERSTKFTELKEENKKRQDEWEGQHKMRMPFYSHYLTQLMEIPEAQGLAQEGIPGEVQQRMLYNIVDSTSNVANNAIVQLSVQNTLVNDVDLSLTKLKQFCSLMLKYIENWMKSLSTQIPNSKRVREQWGELALQIDKLKSVPAEELAAMQQGISAADFHKEMAKVIERISKLESNQEAIMGQSGQGTKPGMECGDEYYDSLNSPGGRSEFYDSLNSCGNEYYDSLNSPGGKSEFYDSLNSCENEYYDSLNSPGGRSEFYDSLNSSRGNEFYDSLNSSDGRRNETQKGIETEYDVCIPPRAHSTPIEEFRSCPNRSRYR